MRVFNAHHSPIGAYSSFTLGALGGLGGLGPESGHPPRQDVIVGARDPDGVERALPFFASDGSTTHTRLDRSPGSGTTVNGQLSMWNSVEASRCDRA